MNNFLKLSKTENEYINDLKIYIQKRYIPRQHHVATIAICNDGKKYYSLHLDIRGFDVCSEPIAVSNAIYEGREKEIVFIASAINTGSTVEIVNPCGNCRQMFLQYTPRAMVCVINDHLQLGKVSATDLLPLPY